AGGHAVVDDVRVEAGQVERREDGRELEDDHGPHVRQVGPQVMTEEGPEHGRSPGTGWCGPADGGERPGDVSKRRAGGGQVVSSGPGRPRAGRGAPLSRIRPGRRTLLSEELAGRRGSVRRVPDGPGPAQGPTPGPTPPPGAPRRRRAPTESATRRCAASVPPIPFTGGRDRGNGAARQPPARGPAWAKRAHEALRGGARMEPGTCTRPPAHETRRAGPVGSAGRDGCHD